MSRFLGYMLSGGDLRSRIADHLHGVMWAGRLLRRTPSGLPELLLLDALDLRSRVSLDIGAHSGSWALALSRRAGPDGRVVAYEALPHYGRALNTAFKLLRVQNVRIRIVAVGDSERTIGLRWRSDSEEVLTGRTHIDPTESSSASIIQVPMVSLDRDLPYCGIRPSDVAFVKIDVEGAELEVIRGASNLLSESHPTLYLEAEPEWLERFDHTVADVFAELSSYGYESYLVTDSGITQVDAGSYLAQYASGLGLNNVLFLHPSNSVAVAALGG